MGKVEGEGNGDCGRHAKINEGRGAKDHVVPFHGVLEYSINLTAVLYVYKAMYMPYSVT